MEGIIRYTYHTIRNKKVALYFFTANIKRASAWHYVAKSRYSAPTRNITGVINFRQVGATREGITPYARHAVPYGHGCQHGTIIESSPQNISTCHSHTTQGWRYVISSWDYAWCAASIIILSDCRSSRIWWCAEDISERILIGAGRCLSRTSTHKRNGDAFKWTATRESAACYARHAVRDGHRRQAATTIESITTYARHAVRNDDGCQAGAIIEGRIIYKPCLYTNNARSDWIIFGFYQNKIWICFISKIICIVILIILQAIATIEDITFYARHAAPYSHRCQAGAILESIPPYARHAVPYGHGCQHGTIIESAPQNISTRHRYAAQWGRNVIGCRGRARRTASIIILSDCPSSRIWWCAEDISERILIGAGRCLSRNSTHKRNSDAFKWTATRESAACYARHAVPYGHGRQAAATREGIDTYALHAVRNCYGRQLGTFIESILPYTCHPISYCQRY